VDRRSDCERRVLAEHAGSENALSPKVTCLNIGETPIAHKYCEGKVKRTLKRE
jgi:hypothetical protein